MKRFPDSVCRHASVLGFKVESPTFATLFLILRKPIFRIHYKEQAAMKQKMNANYKNYKTAAKTIELLMVGSLCISWTSIHDMKLSIDT